jgi:hypothetical protein
VRAYRVLLSFMGLTLTLYSSLHHHTSRQTLVKERERAEKNKKQLLVKDTSNDQQGHLLEFKQHPHAHAFEPRCS